MSDLKQIQSDILSETPERSPVEVGGHQLLLEEMDVNQYQRFAEVSERDDKLRAIYEIIIECLYTPDGQRAFKKEHLDGLMGTKASDGSPSAVLRAKFMEVNDLQGEADQPDTKGGEGN